MKGSHCGLFGGSKLHGYPEFKVIIYYSRFVWGFKITLKVIYDRFSGSKLHGYPEFKVIIFKVSGQIKLTNILPPFTHSKLCEMKS